MASVPHPPGQMTPAQGSVDGSASLQDKGQNQRYATVPAAAGGRTKMQPGRAEYCPGAGPHPHLPKPLVPGSQDAALVKEYGCRISVHGKNKQVKEALEVFAEMKQEGVLPDVGIYTALINVCEKCMEADKAMLDKAFELAAEMKQGGIEPSVQAYNALIRVCTKSNKVVMAWQIFWQMRQRGAQPNLLTYKALLSTCLEPASAYKALEIHAEIKRRNLQPDVGTYTYLIDACEKGNYILKALDIFAEMKKMGVQADVTTYNSVIGACAKGHMADAALHFFTEMKEMGFKPDVITYNSLMHAYVNCNETDEALNAFEEMKQRGLQPGMATYSAVISACERGNRLDKAMEIFAEMRRFGLRPSAVSAGSAGRAFEAFTGMNSKGSNRGMITNSFVSSALAQGQGAEYAAPPASTSKSKFRSLVQYEVATSRRRGRNKIPVEVANADQQAGLRGQASEDPTGSRKKAYNKISLQVSDSGEPASGFGAELHEQVLEDGSSSAEENTANWLPLIDESADRGFRLIRAYSAPSGDHALSLARSADVIHPRSELSRANSAPELGCAAPLFNQRMEKLLGANWQSHLSLGTLKCVWSGGLLCRGCRFRGKTRHCYREWMCFGCHTHGPKNNPSQKRRRQGHSRNS
eukprot:TRINITY_DN17465_c1_g2_i1.p1 TRINITY_DN17465_c1_g2~~TRINITY_DN17465_c1_g2_i1.p1  ORF type:complete len:703 (-),score=92.07 TRINITY_DN17465_c1_g2_i1:261-2174(-)